MTLTQKETSKSIEYYRPMHWRCQDFAQGEGTKLIENNFRVTQQNNYHEIHSRNSDKAIG